MADGRTDDFPLPVGERLRQARVRRNISLDDIATQTRIPLRHLENMEDGAWGNLPAPTYSIGFAKSVAEVVGLDRQEIGDALRIELGGARPAVTPEIFMPADAARVPPRTLAIIAVLLGIILLAGYGYYRSAALGDVQPQIVQDESGALTTTRAGAGGAAPTAGAAASADPVVITANEEVWFRVYERSGATIEETILQAGQSYEVPPTAADPLLRTSRAELLRISVGTADAAAVGPPNTLVKDVSLRPAALLAARPASVSASTPAETSARQQP